MSITDFKIDLVGGPLCGMVMSQASLPDEVALIYRPDPQTSERVVYLRVRDSPPGRPRKYIYAGLDHD
jgi:hypothetical protein